jgi:hypothetical protein
MITPSMANIGSGRAGEQRDHRAEQLKSGVPSPITRSIGSVTCRLGTLTSIGIPNPLCELPTQGPKRSLAPGSECDCLVSPAKRSE